VENLWNIPDFYRLFVCLDSQFKIDHEALGNFQTKVFALGSKSGGADPKLVVAGLEAWDLIDSQIVGLDFTNGPGALGHQDDGRARDCMGLGIGNPATKNRQITLGGSTHGKYAGQT
jgi:hypothetical protein